MPQFTFPSVSVMTWLRAGTISSHFELAPQLPLLPVPPAHCLSLTSLVIDSDRSMTSMMSGGIIFALWVLSAAVRIQRARDVSAVPCRSTRR